MYITLVSYTLPLPVYFWNTFHFRSKHSITLSHLQIPLHAAASLLLTKLLLYLGFVMEYKINTYKNVSLKQSVETLIEQERGFLWFVCLYLDAVLLAQTFKLHCSVLHSVIDWSEIFGKSFHHRAVLSLPTYPLCLIILYKPFGAATVFHCQLVVPVTMGSHSSWLDRLITTFMS